MHTYSEEFSCGKGRLRVDVESSTPVERLLEDLTFLTYRLADVSSEKVTRQEPDIIWRKDAGQKNISYDGEQLLLDGAWEEGELQKIFVSLLALRVEQAGMHPFHSSAIRYRDRTVMFLGGESNSGKSMAQLEGSRRGAGVVSTETVVTDERGWSILGSKTFFLRKRAKGAERSDKPPQDAGVTLFFGEAPEMKFYTEPTDIDLVIVPDIDGHYSTSVSELGDFEKDYQTFHCLMNYFGMHQLLAPGLVMPIIDTDAYRQQRAAFCRSFCKRPYYMIRAKDPKTLLDEVDKLMG